MFGWIRRGEYRDPPPSTVDPALVNYVRDVDANPVAPPRRPTPLRVGVRLCDWCEVPCGPDGTCTCCQGRMGTCVHTPVEQEPAAGAVVGPTALHAAAQAFQTAIAQHVPPSGARTAAEGHIQAALASALAGLPRAPQEATWR